jgi:hypothetical protein
MSFLGGPRYFRANFEPRVEHVLTQHALNRILSFLNCSIDDVCNDAIVKGKVRGFFKLHKQIERSAEITELERQWNPLRG